LRKACQTGRHQQGRQIGNAEKQAI
jgi:hypothetical protein